MKYKWANPLKISVGYQGKTYAAFDDKSWWQLLKALKIDAHTDEKMTEDKRSMKRKSYTPESPLKRSNIYMLS